MSVGALPSMSMRLCPRKVSPGRPEATEGGATILLSMSSTGLFEDERVVYRRRAARRRRIREARLRRLGYADYRGYISSSCWRETRERYWRDPDTLKVCVLCGSSGPPLQLHHRTYVRVGSEALDDLVPTCLACHQLVHALDGRGDLDGLDADLSVLVDARRAAEHRRKSQETVSPMTEENRRRRAHLVRRIETDRRKLAQAEEIDPDSDDVSARRRRLSRIEGQIKWIDEHPALVLNRSSLDHRVGGNWGRMPPWIKRRLEAEIRARLAERQDPHPGTSDPNPASVS